MGKNNKARRAAKAKRRAQQAGHATGRTSEAYAGPFGIPGAGPSLADQAADAWSAALDLPAAAASRLPAILARLERIPAGVADEVAEQVLLRLPSHLWSSGWQPAEVQREARRRAGARAARLAEVAMLVDHERRPDQRLDPRWAAQVAELGQRQISTRGGWLGNWRDAEAITRLESYHAVVEVWQALAGVPALDVLIPPPGAGPSAVTLGAPLHAGANQPMLERIRKLLAKAESTTFEEEAEALTAKAQALMTRHAIDEALIHRTASAAGPRMMRVPIDAPYADAKSVLLATVASANRCQSVYLPAVALGSVVGHDDDLALVEMLFTSLLVQAQRALTHAGRAATGSRARSQSFRASFYLAYAGRIGERLEGVNGEVYAEGGSAAALPVLRAKEDAVADFVGSHYGDRLTTGGVRGAYDLAGHAAGRRAADEARLDSGALLSG